VSIRVPPTRWIRAMRAAKGQGEDVSKAVNRFLDEYADAYEAELAAKAPRSRGRVRA
jgi:hypothetical protein